MNPILLSILPNKSELSVVVSAVAFHCNQFYVRFMNSFMFSIVKLLSQVRIK